MRRRTPLQSVKLKSVPPVRPCTVYLRAYLRFQAQPIDYAIMREQHVARRSRGSRTAIPGRSHAPTQRALHADVARAANAWARADLQLFGYKPWHPGEPVRVHERWRRWCPTRLAAPRCVQTSHRVAPTRPATPERGPRFSRARRTSTGPTTGPCVARTLFSRDASRPSRRACRALRSRCRTSSCHRTRASSSLATATCCRWCTSSTAAGASS